MNEATILTTTSDAVTEQDNGRCAPAPGSGSDPAWCRYEKRRNDKHVKDALGHLRHVKKGFMACRRWGRVVAAICELEEWEKLPR